MYESLRKASVDLDGVAFQRIPIQFGGLAARAQFWNDSGSYTPTLVTPTFVTFDGQTLPLRNPPSGYIERKSLKIHTGRKIDPGLRTLLQGENYRAIVGNTGRPDKQAWVDMTMERLTEEGFAGILDGVYFKPEGAASEDTKYSVLFKMQQEGYEVTHYDDNALTIRRLALLLPNVNFVLVRDFTSGVLFSEKERKKYPNVSTIALRDYR